jgi:hypothetical protein
VRAPGRDGRLWLAQALAAGPPGPSAARGRALTWCGQLDNRHGEAEAGRVPVEEAVARQVGDGSLLCLTLSHLALYAADRATAPALLEESVAMARAAGDRRASGSPGSASAAAGSASRRALKAWLPQARATSWPYRCAYSWICA